MALLGAYKPKYEDSISGVMKSSPAAKIAGITTLGVAPLIAAGFGKVMNTGRAMFSDTGDPMAMVKGRTQQVAGELSDYTNGKAGKPTIAVPAPVSVSAPAPTASVKATPPISAVSPGAQVMTPKDLSRLSNGSLPGKTVRPAPARKAASIAVPTIYSQPDEEGLRAPEGVATSPMLPAGQRIFEMSGADAGGMNGAEIAGNGGFATMDGRTFVLPSRSEPEEKQFQAQLAQQNTQPPVAGITALAPQTSTVGYGNGIETYGAGGNLISSTRSLDSNATLGDLAMEKFNTNQQAKRAGIANINSEITTRGNKDVIAAAELPSVINKNNAAARHSNISADIGLAKAPTEIAGVQAATDQTKANTFKIIEMMNPEKNALLADAKYKEGLLKIAGDKLGILKKQIAIRAEQASNKGSAADWGGISKSALEGIKLIDAKAALGGMTPEDEQLRKNYLDTYNMAFPRQQRLAYQQPPVAVDGGE